MRFRRAAKSPIFALSFAARTCHARFARLTRARRTRFGRRTARVLLADFWYFWSHKSTTNEKLLYDSSRANNVRPLSRRRQHTCFAYVLIPLLSIGASLELTHMLRICVNPLDGGTFPKRCTKTLAVAREKFIISISRTHTKKASAALSRSFHFISRKFH